MTPSRCAECGGLYSPQRGSCPRCARTPEAAPRARQRPATLRCRECGEVSPGSALSCVACGCEFRANAPDVGREVSDGAGLKLTAATLFGAFLFGFPVWGAQTHGDTSVALVGGAAVLGAVLFAGIAALVIVVLGGRGSEVHELRRKRAKPPREVGRS
jgi:hypothetical protein